MTQDTESRISGAAAGLSTGKLLVRLGFAGVGAYILYKLLFRADGDRPAMTVRGGSIIFENESDDNGHPVGWVSAGNNWKQAGSFAATRGFRTCNGRTGDKVEVTYGSARFTIKITGVPMIQDHGGRLTLTNGGLTLTFDGGNHPINLEIGGQTCTVPSTGRTRIEMIA